MNGQDTFKSIRNKLKTKAKKGYLLERKGTGWRRQGEKLDLSTPYF